MREPFFMQWHITDRCILNCAHCYRDDPKDDLPFDDLLEILDRFAGFLDEYRVDGRINFGGGESLLRKHELFTLMRKAGAMQIECRLLTNGLLIDNATARELKDAGCAIIQVSVDGDRETHENIRGEETFDAALRGAQRAKAVGMDVTISMTVSRWNVAELGTVAGIARQLHARLFVNRFVPYGHGVNMQDQMLTADEWLNTMIKCMDLHRKGMRVLLRDPLFTPLSGNYNALRDGCIGGCSVGYRGIAVDSNGDVYPCRRLPVVVGNLLKESFDDVWRAPFMNALRDRDGLKGRCGKCAFRWACGGCRAIAFTDSGDALAEDPQCSWQNHRLNLMRYIKSIRPFVSEICKT